MKRCFTKYPQDYIRATSSTPTNFEYVRASKYDRSEYPIAGFTPDKYEMLKQCVSNRSIDSDTVFGGIEAPGSRYLIEVSIQDYGEQDLLPQWDVYDLRTIEYENDIPYNDSIESGSLDLSLSYDNQVDYLISVLEHYEDRYFADTNTTDDSATEYSVLSYRCRDDDIMVFKNLESAKRYADGQIRTAYTALVRVCKGDDYGNPIYQKTDYDD